MWRGFYPKLHDKKVNPADELAFYVNTYLERDVREIENVRNLRTFSVFLRLAPQFGADTTCTVVYGGDESQSRSGFNVRSWREIG